MSTEAMKWMDIETAPKDGTEILIGWVRRLTSADFYGETR